MKTIFIDGYNVLNSWPILKNIINDNFDSARKKLIDILHNYSVYENVKIIIVFDGYKVEGNTETVEKINSKLIVVYTKSGETADSYIERNVHMMGKRSEMYVVTSDCLEQQTIFSHGAIRIPSLEFYSEVSNIQKKLQNKINKNSIIHKNHLQDNIDEEILKKLENMRRSK